MNEEEIKDKKTYELALLLKNEEDLTGVLAFIRAHDAEIVSEPRAKRLALAYAIKGVSEAVFVSCMFQAIGQNAKNIEKDLVTNAHVIRSMVVVAPPPSAERQQTSTPVLPGQERERGGTYRPTTRTFNTGESKPAAPRPLSNEALEKKIEEILA